jgi:predicted DNA-binding transcriptional regulator
LWTTMSDKTVGLLLLIGSVLGILIYGWLVFLSPGSFVGLEIKAFAGIARRRGILAWLGSTLASTPPPEPLPSLAQTEGQKREAAQGEKKE